MSGRVYERKIDWDEARRLRAEGWTYMRLAERYGVTYSAVWLVCNDDARELNMKRVKAWTMSGVCEECGGSCVRAGHGARTRHAAADGRLLCKTCRGKARRTGITVVNGAIHVRCGSCRTEKPLTEFGPRVARLIVAGEAVRKRTCRACETAKRQAYRERNKVPCTACGKPRLAPNELRRKGPDTGLCSDCWHKEWGRDHASNVARRAADRTAA